MGSSLYARGGWIASGSYSVASIGGALVMCLLRGPWEERWIGWRGGWAVFQAKLPASSTDTSEKVDDDLEQPGNLPAQGTGNESTIETIEK